MKTLAEMTTGELESLKTETYAAYRASVQMWKDTSMSDPRWTEIHGSRQQTMTQYHRIDDELDRRGA